MTSTTRTGNTVQPDHEEADRWRRAVKARRRVKRGSSDRSGEPSPWQEVAIRAMEDAQPADAGEWA